MRTTSLKVSYVFQLNGYYYVKPENGSYEMIYRAARGVYWDDEKSSLYFKGARLVKMH